MTSSRAKEVWAHIPDGDTQSATRALEAGASTLVTATPKVLEGLSRAPVLAQQEDGSLVGPDGPVPWLHIRSPDDQDAVRDLIGTVPVLIVDPSDWKVIPEENLVAWAQGSTTRIIVACHDANAARTALGALERGVDGVLVPPDLVADVVDDLRTTPTMTLQEAEVTSIEPVGMGDRVCIDTCSILTPNEGLLIGSQASHLFLVLSENKDSGYVSARPFRVNAGAVHQYVLAPDGRTSYLSECHGGLEVLVTDTQGASRRAVIGRAKVEHRPLLLIRARTGEGEVAHVVLQDAETIRVATTEGAKSVSTLEAGDRLLVHAAPSARHFGVAIEERVIER